MKQFSSVIILFLLFSCSKNEKKVIPVIGEMKICAIVKKPDGGRNLEGVLRVIRKNVVTDSVSNEDKIVYDTAYGVAYYPPLIDSTGKQVLDSITKQPRYRPNPYYIKISKDSIVWRIENVSIDSLLKM